MCPSVAALAKPFHPRLQCLQGAHQHQAVPNTFGTFPCCATGWRHTLIHRWGGEEHRNEGLDPQEQCTANPRLAQGSQCSSSSRGRLPAARDGTQGKSQAESSAGLSSHRQLITTSQKQRAKLCVPPAKAHHCLIRGKTHQRI